MKMIEKLSEYIEDELEGAECYAKKALKYREENPTLAKTFYDMSMDEMKHVDLLHGEVVKLIETHRKEHGEPPVAMMAVYNYLHEKQIEEANEVRMYQNQFRGM